MGLAGGLHEDHPFRFCWIILGVYPGFAITFLHDLGLVIVPFWA